jgi:hypothetical protein
VRVTAATTYSETVRATSKVARIGMCAVVQGSANASGAVTARSIAISPADKGSCSQTIGQPGFR